MCLFWSRCVKSNYKNNSFTPNRGKKKKKKTSSQKYFFCKIRETIEYSGKGFISMEIP